MKPRMQRMAWALPVALAVAAYLPALGGERVWDDQTALGAQLAAFRSLADVLFPPAGIPDWTYSYYRPLVTLSYLLDRWLAGPTATILPHAANIAGHALVTGLVWLLAARLFRGAPAGRAAALLAAALFAVHPIHAEAVSWITGRSDVLATLFLLPALLFALQWRDRRAPAALCLAPVCLLLALLAKETAIAALLLMPLLYVFVPRDAQPVSAGRIAFVAALAMALACATALATYLWMRHAAGIQAGESPGLEPVDFLGRLAAAAAFYLRKAFVPWPQSNLVSWAMVPGRLGTTLILLAAATLTAWSMVMLRRTRDAVPLVAACWFWIAIAVPLWSAVGLVTRTPLAERHLYLPSIGIALGLAALWRPVMVRGGRGRRTAMAVVAVAVVAGYGVATVRRGFVWQTDLALWSSAAGQVRDQGLPWLNLGMARLRTGDEAGALAAFHEVTVGGDEPRFRARAHAAMGTLLVRSGDLAGAESHFRTAIALRPEMPEPYYGLASVNIARAGASSAAGAPGAESRDLALHFLRRALDRNGRFYPARLQLARQLAEEGDRLERQGERDRAIGFHREALRELDVLVGDFPPERRAQALAVLRTEVGIDAAELRRSIERHIAGQP